MSADLLREAASAIRADYADQSTAGFQHAVADWLDDQLDAFLHARPGSHISTQMAVAVARAYLGDAS